MHGLKQLTKSDAKRLDHHFHPNQSGFEVLAFQRVAADLLEPRMRKSDRSRRSRQRAYVVPSRKRLTCGLQPDALASADYQYSHWLNPIFEQRARLRGCHLVLRFGNPIGSSQSPMIQDLMADPTGMSVVSTVAGFLTSNNRYGCRIESEFAPIVQSSLLCLRRRRNVGNVFHHRRPKPRAAPCCDREQLAPLHRSGHGWCLQRNYGPRISRRTGRHPHPR